MLENFVWSDEAVDPRPLRRLGVVSGSVLLAAVVLLVHEHHRGAAGLSGGRLLVVWLVVAVAGLLLLGAVSGLLARGSNARHRRLDPQEAHDRQVVRALLRRGTDVPPELRGVAQRVVDDTAGERWSPLLWVVLGGFWAGTAFTYTGWDRWFRLALGLVYLAMLVSRLLDRRRLLRRAARAGIRPVRTWRSRWVGRHRG